MEKLVYAFMAGPDEQEQAVILVRSIRAFAGELAECPIWVFAPLSIEKLSNVVQEQLLALNVRLFSFAIEPEALGFTLAAKVYASAQAEALAKDEAELLAWLDTDMLVIREPGEFLLDSDKTLGYHPVHHKLIGSSYAEPLDEYWSLAYEHCNVPNENVFPMMTHVGNDKIQPYFNAGMLVLRPEKGVFHLWGDNFDRLYREPFFEAFYQKHVLYRVFFHQVILSGSILAAIPQAEMKELSPLINYPLHLIEEDVSGQRPTKINDLVTCRHENIFQRPDWETQFSAEGDLRQWIIEQFNNGEEQ